MSLFNNTTKEVGQELENATSKAEHQNKLVLELFRNEGTSMGPSTVYRKLMEADKIDMNVPITSIRRSITNLTNKRYLVKTGQKSIGSYGRSEYLWCLNEGAHRE